TLVDQLSLYKYNQLQLYVEHVIDLDDTIESWIGHSPLTCSEIIDLDEYCYARGIELVPTLATFGHMYEILRSNSYKQLGEFPEQSERPFSFVERMMHHTLNPTNPNTIPFISKRIKDYASLFKSNKFNIGADETFDLGCGESKNVAEKIGVANLYLSYIKKLCEKLHELGLQPIMYADIAIKHPEL
ncbi:glycosyl hydrolase family 20, partial [Gardnerella vaginalis]